MDDVGGPAAERMGLTYFVGPPVAPRIIAMREAATRSRLTFLGFNSAPIYVYRPRSMREDVGGDGADQGLASEADRLPRGLERGA